MRTLLAFALILFGASAACEAPPRNEPPGHQGQQHMDGWQCLHGAHGQEGHDYVRCNHCSHGPH